MVCIIKTDVGVVRTENQDRAAFFEHNDIALAILCDGMGGHRGGSQAATIAITVFEKEFKKARLTIDNLTTWFMNTMDMAVKQMTSYSNTDEHLLDMGTTLTAAVIMPRQIVIFNIGDSRTYVYNGQLIQVTRDQNLRNYYIDVHKKSEDEASQLIGAAALTSALGPRKNAKPAAYLIDWEPQLDYLVLTSDGVHDFIAKPVFEQILQNESLTLVNKADEIVARAIRGKSSDNLTIAIVDLKG